MAIPNYMYLKLKILGHKGIIMVGTHFEQAYECNTEYCQFTVKLIRSEKLAEEPPLEDLEVPETSKRAAHSFMPAKDAKEVMVASDGRTLHIGTALETK